MTAMSPFIFREDEREPQGLPLNAVSAWLLSLHVVLPQSSSLLVTLDDVFHSELLSDILIAEEICKYQKFFTIENLPGRNRAQWKVLAFKCHPWWASWRSVVGLNKTLVAAVTTSSFVTKPETCPPSSGRLTHWTLLQLKELIWNSILGRSFIPSTKEWFSTFWSPSVENC
jgi:hypothetical protein